MADCFSASEVGKFIETLVREGAGFRTPQAFLYALDFYAVIFGFAFKKEDCLRWKRMSDDYSKSAPPKSQAPFVEVPLMHYLEQVVLAEDRPLVHRVTAGKLRLRKYLLSSLAYLIPASTDLGFVSWQKRASSIWPSKLTRSTRSILTPRITRSSNISRVSRSYWFNLSMDRGSFLLKILFGGSLSGLCSSAGAVASPGFFLGRHSPFPEGDATPFEARS